MGAGSRERTVVTRNLVLSGGVAHPFAATSARLVELLAGLGVTSEVEEDLEAGTARLVDGGYDLVTVNALRWRMLPERYAPQRAAHAYSPSPAARQALAGFVGGGGSLLAVHAASICFDDWPEWGEVVGGAWNWDRSSHPPLGPVAVTVRTGAHPIVAGVGDFEVVDEAYGFLDLQPDVEGLMFAAHGGADHPLLWARHYGLGRVVYSGLGHDERAYRHPAYRIILERAAGWLLAVEDAPDALRPDSRSHQGGPR
ncbi:MAG: ThuA domain-containing protein [Actinomycetota bacterium]|nr:ThuA domain-containing protein [Actinomycetota bacterium]